MRSTYGFMKVAIPLLLVCAALCMPKVLAQDYQIDALIQIEREKLEEQKRANAAVEERLKEQAAARRAEEYNRHQENLKSERLTRDNNVSCSGDGTITDNPHASKLAWYYLAYFVQQLPHGALAVDYVPTSWDDEASFTTRNNVAYIEGISVGDGDVGYFTAYRNGTYNYTDKKGNKRSVPRYVLKNCCKYKEAQLNSGSIKPL